MNKFNNMLSTLTSPVSGSDVVFTLPYNCLNILYPSLNFKSGRPISSKNFQMSSTECSGGAASTPGRYLDVHVMNHVPLAAHPCLAPTPCMAAPPHLRIVRLRLNSPAELRFLIMDLTRTDNKPRNVEKEPLGTGSAETHRQGATDSS